MDSYDKVKISEDESKEINIKTFKFVLKTFVILSLFFYIATNLIVKSLVVSAFITTIATFFYFDNLMSKFE